MKFSTFCVIIAIIGAIFTLAFLVVPVQTVSHYGAQLDAAGVSIARLFAGALGSLVVATWMVRNQDAGSAGARAVLWGSVFFNVVSLISTTYSIEHGVMNSLGWSSVALNALILIGLFYFLGKKKAAA
jgi:hypothetical protein